MDNDNQLLRVLLIVKEVVGLDIILELCSIKR